MLLCGECVANRSLLLANGIQFLSLFLVETRDGKRYYDPGPKTPEMQRLNSSFAKLHGASSLSNVVGLGAMVLYAFTLAEMM